MLCMSFPALLLVAIAITSAVVTVKPAHSQITPISPARSVRIFGRIVLPDGKPVDTGVELFRIDYGFEKSGRAGPGGIFSFIVLAGPKYRISLGPMIKTASKVLDTALGKDIDVGDLVFEYCPAWDHTSAKPPTTAPLSGSLSLDQIIIEPQPPSPGDRRFFWDWEPAPQPYKYVQRPQCWSPYVKVDHRTEWEGVGGIPTDIHFDRYISIEQFLGGTLKAIHVTWHDPKLTRQEIRDEVRKVWFGVFADARKLGWSWGPLRTIAASVEFEDGKPTSLLIGGTTHVLLQDRVGQYWYIYLRPAV